jgi:peptidyl-prolyl cis-trans isomerase D
MALQKLGDSLKGQRWLAYTVLGALALVFAAWGAYGIVDISFGPGAYAAKVNGEKITGEEVREAWLREQPQWQQRYGGEIPPDEQRRLQDNLLEGMVRGSLLTERTRELGYRVSQQQINEAIRNVPQFQIDGKYNADSAKAVLAQVGLSVEQFKRDVTRDLQRQQVQEGLRASDFLTAHELERLFALENEQREVRYAVLPPEKFAAGADVSDAAVAKYYEANKRDFLTPESVRLRYGELRLDQLASQVAISDQELRDAYEAAKDRYVEPERRRARHILISVEAPKDDAAARKKAEDVLAQARSGKDFAALAKEFSQDPGSAAQGGDLGWSDRGAFVAPFADALFSMSVGEIRGPVKTQYGYHVIRLDEIQPGKTKTFEEARGELEAQLHREGAGELFGDRHEQIELRIEQAGGDLDALASEFGLTVGTVDPFMRGGGGAPLGSSPDLQEVVFSDTVLNQRRIGGPLMLGEDRLVIVQVLDHRRPAPRPLAEVREDIISALREEHGTQEAEKAARDAQQRLAGGASFDEVVRALGLEVEAARYIGRFDPSVPAQVREEAFALPKPAADQPSVSAITLDGGGAAVVAVTSSRVDQPDPNPELRAQRVRMMQARLAMRDVAAYVEELRRTADVTKNPKVFE